MRDGIDIGKVVRIGICALFVLAVAVAAVVALASRWGGGPAAHPIGTPRSWIAGPLLESAPQADLARYLESKRRLIQSYAWVDKEAGVARIPLQEAMRALAERGGSSKEAP
jgi:hypothetical protein